MKMKKLHNISAFILILSIGLLLSGCASTNYKKALGNIANGEYEEAIELLRELDDYKDSQILLEETEEALTYQTAVANMESEEYEKAITLLKQLGDYKDAKTLLSEAEKSLSYQTAMSFIEAKNYEEATKILGELADYKDSKSQFLEVKFTWASDLYKKGEFTGAIAKLVTIANEHKPSKELLKEIRYNYAVKLFGDKAYDDALQQFMECDDYKLTANKLDECAESLFAEGEYSYAVKYYYLHDDSEEAKQEMYYSCLNRQMEEHDYRGVESIYSKIKDYKDVSTNDKFAGARLISMGRVSHLIIKGPWLSTTTATMNVSFEGNMLHSSFYVIVMNLISGNSSEPQQINESWEYKFEGRNIYIKEDDEFVYCGRIGTFSEDSVNLTLDLPGMWKTTDVKFD